MSGFVEQPTGSTFTHEPTHGGTSRVEICWETSLGIVVRHHVKKKNCKKKERLFSFLLHRELAKEQFWWHPGGGGPNRILERRSDPPSGPVRGFPPIMRASRRRPGMDIFPPAARTPTTIAGRISRRLSPGDMYGHVVPVDGTGGRFPRALVADRVETGGGGGVAAAAGARVATSICRARRRLPGSLHAVAVSLAPCTPSPSLRAARDGT